MTNKPKEIVDIDAGDANNELAAKQTCANVPTAAVDGLQQWLKRMAPKPAVQKKVTAKPKPVEVIEISDEKDSEDKTVHKKKEADVNSKKKPSCTLISVLIGSFVMNQEGVMRRIAFFRTESQERRVSSSVFMTLNLMPAVQELHKLDSQDLCRLLKDAGNFSVHHHTGKGVLLEVASFLAS
ncbi:unnamed protein product [Trifolium pratense]|uniref:Uncharacterized protein n=1 Tax=Trifolium pratense TaxID=57577 RepID=A0ACB0JEX3_TRIPR|nr:unnamed protein product [Trifolium pratense]